MTNELYHYGIKGMKWGVRRYENKDGTLTPAGKKRYNYEDHQKKQDARLYGKRSVRRIQKRLDNGETLLSARNAEVRRRNKINVIKRNLKLASVASLPILAATAYAYKQQKEFNDASNRFWETHRKGQEMLRRASSMRNPQLDSKSKEIMDRLNKVLSNRPNMPNKSNSDKNKGSASENIKKLFENSAKREAQEKSSFEKKMKEYWDNGGREKWEKKNRKGGR